MSRREPPSKKVAQEGYFSEVTVERFRSEKDLARDHVIGRNRRVGQLLCYLSLMRAHGLIAVHSAVSCKAARFQDFKSKKPKEAAHYLPGQIIISWPGQKERDPSYFVNNPDTKGLIGGLFSRVQDLPANFNKADSYIEKYAKPGLKAVLAGVCQRLIRGQNQTGSKVSPLVYQSYLDWIAQSLAVYRYGINRKVDIADLDENPPPPATVPSWLEDEKVFEPHLFQPSSVTAWERAVRKNGTGQTTATVWDYSRQIRILGYYVEFTERDSATLNSRLVSDVEQSFSA